MNPTNLCGLDEFPDFFWFNLPFVGGVGRIGNHVICTNYLLRKWGGSNGRLPNSDN